MTGLAPARLPAAALLLFLASFAAAAEAATVSGRVTDVDGAPLAGANVAVVGTDAGAVTDGGGRFRIAGVEPGQARLRASLIGFLTVYSGRFEVTGADAQIDLVLHPEPIEMNPTVISASAIGEAVRRAPNRVNVVGSTDLALAPARNVQEVLQHVEGLYISRGEGLLVTFPQIIVRGMSTGYLGRSTAALTMLNGHAINGSLGSWASVGDLDAIPLPLVQKTEVIKGPYASTYGSGATGGVINVLTRRHFDRPLGGSVEIEGGPYAYRTVTPVVFGQGQHLSFGAWGQFLHGGERETRRRSTWNDTAFGYLARGRVDHSKYGFLLGYDMSARDRLEVLGNRLVKVNNYNGRPISKEVIDGRMLQVTFTRQLDDRHRLTILGDWLHTDYDGPVDATPVHPDSADALVKLQRWPNRELGMKVVLSGRLGNRHRYSAGVEWRRNDNERTTWYGDREVLEFDVRGTQDIYSIFLEDKVAFGDLEVTPGVRLEQWKDDALYSRQADPVEDLTGDGKADRVHAGYKSGRNTREAVNPKVGLAWFVAPALKLRAAAGSTFRAPRITETYSPDYQTLAFLLYRSNPDLREERIISYEAGADYASADGRWALSLTGYFVDARDRIEFTFLGGFTAQDPFVIEHRNFDQEITGLEGEAKAQVRDDLSLGINLSLVKAEYASGPFSRWPDPRDPTRTRRNTPPGVPDHTVNAHLDWTVRPGLQARLSAQRVGTIWDDNANTVTLDETTGQVVDTAELDPYELVNLKVRYELDLGAVESVYVDAEAANLLDADYDVYANRVWDYKPLGRTLHVALGYRF